MLDNLQEQFTILSFRTGVRNTSLGLLRLGCCLRTIIFWFSSHVDLHSTMAQKQDISGVNLS